MRHTWPSIADLGPAGMVDWEVSAGKELRYDSVQEAHASLGNNATHCVASSIIDEQGEDRVVGAAFLVPRGGVRTSHTCEMIVIVDQSFRGLGIGSSCELGIGAE